MAPKAKGESKRGLVVTLVFFILATIGLGLATYYGFQDQEKKDAAVKAAVEKASLADQERDWYRFQVAMLMAYLDKAPEPTTPVGRELANKAAFDAGNYPDPKTKLGTIENVKLEIPLLKAFLAKQNARSPWDPAKNGPRDNVEAVDKARLAEIADLKAKLVKAEVDRVDEQNKRTAAEANRAKDQAGFNAALEKIKKEFETDRVAFAKQINELQDTLKKAEDKKDVEFIKPIVAAKELAEKSLAKANAELKEANLKLLAMQEKVDARGEDKPADPTPRGKIVRVHINPRKATIDLGRTHGLTPQTTFAVHGYQPNGKPKVRSKANVEVITVGETTSEVLVTALFHPDPNTDNLQGARKVIDVLSQDNIDPIVAGDALINSLWNPNSKTHIAIAGQIDLAGTGAVNLSTLVQLLEKMNIVVDAYIDPLDGSVKGRGLTRRTDYVLLGVAPTSKEDDPVGKKVAEAIKKMVDDGKSNGIRMMSPRRFLQETGFNMPRNVISD